MRTDLLPLLALLLLALAGPALASDGVLEINQTCAINTGCFSGDTPGLPVTIDGTAGRSYRLTGDLVIQSVNSDGILVSTPDVAIDLGGFTIIGLACVGETGNCTPFSGSGSGVIRSSFATRGTSVKNGSITGMGSYGVFLGDQAEISGLRVRWNRLDGIAAGAGSTVSGNTAYQNGRDGISASSGSTVSGNTVFQNGDEGINAGSGSTVQRNTVRGNSGYGISLSVSAAYRENVITSNVTGTVLGGVNRGDNYCNGTGVVSSFCP